MSSWFSFGESKPAPPPPPPKDEGFFGSIRTAGISWGGGGEPEPPPSALDSAMSYVGLRPKPPPTPWEEIKESFSMTWTTRFYGCIACLVAAAILFIASVLFIWLLLLVGFGVCYTFANIFLLASTFFLVGPMRQMRLMFAPARLISTIIYLAALGLTIFVAIKTHNALLVLLMVVIQFCAIVWYVASYLPFAQTLIKHSCGACAKGLTEI
jgi:hypothetical protein